LIEEKNERKMGRKKISGWNFSDLEGQKWKIERSVKNGKCSYFLFFHF
jgi:hypothetical protein